MIEKKKIIARRYAEAFFSAIEEAGEFEECFKDFEAFTALYFGYEGLSEVLLHPTIHVDQKIALIRKIFGTSAQTLVIDFISLLIKKKRLGLFERISQEVERLYRRKNGIRGIIIKSAVPLLKDERQKLRAILSDRFGRVEIREIVDPGILGGLIVQFTDQVVDESIRNRMRNLRELMIRIDNEWLAKLIDQPTIAL
ncbi:MAG: F0F1 ATP synthase subunit delta [Candidatus Rifleibacteriota bacterium]